MDENACRICGNSSLKQYFRDGHPYHVTNIRMTATLFACDSCGHKQFLPDITSEQLAPVYAEMYDDPASIENIRRDYSVLAGHFLYFVQRIEELSLLTGHGRHARIHEFGCGAGIIVKHLRDRGYNATGSEWSESAARAARQLGNDHIFVEDLNTMKRMATEAVDIVIMSHTIEHLPDPVSAVKGLVQLLGPRSVIQFFTNQGDGVVQRAWGMHFDPWCYWPQHIHYFSPESFAALANSAGAKAIQIGTTTRYFRHVDAILPESSFPWPDRIKYLSDYILGLEMEMTIARRDSPFPENVLPHRAEASRDEIPPHQWSSHRDFFSNSPDWSRWAVCADGDGFRELAPMVYNSKDQEDWYFNTAFVGQDFLAHYDDDILPMLKFTAPESGYYRWVILAGLRFFDSCQTSLITLVNGRIFDEMTVRLDRQERSFGLFLEKGHWVGLVNRAHVLKNRQWTTLLMGIDKIL